MNVVCFKDERIKRQKVKINPDDLIKLLDGLTRLKAESEIVLGKLLRKKFS